MNKFKVGDVVKLKGSFTPITVSSTNENEVLCQWFDGFDLRSNGFNEEQLELIAANEQRKAMKEEGKLLQEKEKK